MRREIVSLFASQDLIQLLSSMKHKIAYILKDNIRFRTGAPITYLDFGKTNDTISFIYSNKLRELQNKHMDSFKEYVWNDKRSEMKIGKVIKLLFNNDFPINKPKGSPNKELSDDIESFVNIFKSLRDKMDNKDNFELVKGKDIKFWYDQDNYSRFIQEDTTLAKSCLRYKESGKFLEMYVKNPDIISMLILKDDANKLRGRAIVWNLDKPKDRIFMDRVYTVNDSDVELYKNYAIENGWLYKKRQTFGYDNIIVDGRTGEEKNWDNFLLKTKINTPPNKYYPYLDTLSVYNTEKHTLCNDGRLLIKPPHIRLTDYQGSYIDEADYRDMVFSNTYGHDIPREESEYVEIDDDWVYSFDVVHVYNTNDKKAYKNNNKIKKSLILGKVKYFLNEDCIYSDYLKTHIYSESAREVYVDIEKTKKGLVHKKMINTLFKLDDDGDYVLKIMNSIKENNIEITNEEYNEHIQYLLRNGRSNLRQILSGEYLLRFNKKRLSKKDFSEQMLSELYNIVGTPDGHILRRNYDYGNTYYGNTHYIDIENGNNHNVFFGYDEEQGSNNEE